MKRTAVIATILVLLLCLVSCAAAPAPTPEPPEAVEPSAEVETPKVLDLLTGELLEDETFAKRKPIGVFLTSSLHVGGELRGVSDAKLVFETELAGGLCRMLALFSADSDAAQVGPFRGPYGSLLEAALSADPVYCVMINRDSQYDCMPTVDTSLGCTLLDLADLTGEADVSDGGYVATDMEKMEEYGLENCKFLLLSELTKDEALTGGECAATEPFFNYSAEPAQPEQPASHVSFAISAQGDAVYFDYDSASGRYLSSRIDEATGEPIQFDNLFVLFAQKHAYEQEDIKYYSYVDWSAGGEGRYFCDGKGTDITWSKADAQSPLTLFDKDNNELAVSPGTGYIAFVNDKNAELLEYS